MDLFKELDRQHKEFRKNLNPFRGTGCCGGRPSKYKKNTDYNYIPISQDDITNL